MASPQNITARQLTRAREAQFHRDGDPLQTTDAIRTWIEAAGLLPVYPLAQFQAPMPSFAEAVLGRPENGYVPRPKRSAAATEPDALNESPDGIDDESYEFDVEDDEPEENFASDDDDPIDDEEDVDESEDEDEPATAEGDEAMLAGDGNIPADPETMLSDDDEFSEDEGDDIAEEDRIHADGNPVPNDLREDESANEAEDTEAEAPVPSINGFSPEERETVQRALARLIEDGTVVPLNLLGNSTGEPDYIVPASAFSFVYTLRGDKNWKNEPATTGPMRVSPLAAKVFTLLKEKGAKAPHELTGMLGQGITDSATLRALNELWAIQRIIPLPDADGKPAKWELVTSKFLRHMKAGANAGQPTALSALLSLYLNQAIAATGDDMEIFLSPLAARSRVREVVHGLSATRQLEEIVIDGKTLLHIAGGLPEMPADDSKPVSATPQRSRYEADDRRAEIEDRRARFGTRDGEHPARRTRGEDRADRPAPSSADRPSFGGRPRKPFGDRKPFGARRPGDGERERRPFQRREANGDRPGFAPRADREGGAPRERGGFQPRERKNFPPRGDGQGFQSRERSSYARPWDEDRPRRSEGGDGERRPFAPRQDRGAERRPYQPRGERGGFPPREGGERRGYVPRGDRPYAGRGDREDLRPGVDREGRPFNRLPGAPERGQDRRERPFSPRESGFGGPRKSFGGGREGGERRPFTPREGGFGGPRKPFGGGREGGERGPFTPREGGFGGPRKPFGNREGGERRSFAPREGAERRPFTPREGGRPSFGGGNRPAFGGRPRFDRNAEGGDREGGERRSFPPRGDRPSGGFGRATGGFGADRTRFRGEPGEGRPSFQSGAHSAGPGGSKFGGSGFGRDRGGKGAPGKFGKPGFKPSRKGPGSGPGRGGAPKRRPE